ncbi:IclR family transcriptional regulator [Alkalibacillus aidingensis]|uniref:IclR family transcriptional regulator n=1 Tax=Alkalibacillus aidingensis TaxID=2747607 RepID=UPI0016612F48|nr:IclR family transcriptional regulator [Alkalibacillus aidingensis]
MSQSVIKALKLLDFFTEDIQELTLRELSIKAQLRKSTAYRLLASLEDCGFVYKVKETDYDSKYRLGLKLLELGNLVLDQLDLKKIAKPYMEDLVGKINEAVHLVILHENRAVYIDKVDSNRSLRLYTKVGKSTPLYIGSGPKLLLAHLPFKKQNYLLNQGPLLSLDGETIDKKEIEKELAEINQQGFSVSIGEQDKDTTGISYPIFDHQGIVVAALAISGLSSRFEGQQFEIIKKNSQETANRISKALGFIQI